MALKELEDRLPSASPPDDSEALSLDEAMAFIRSHTPRDVKASRQPPSLFDSLPTSSASDEPSAPQAQRHGPSAADPLQPNPANRSATRQTNRLPAPAIASGEKAKARDILAAIRTLKTIEQEQRPATPEEKQTLARFAGFGPVALSIFPDPVTGRYKDAGWQALGEELKTLLTPAEYDSAKRTTFNAFYTSPTVIAAMHEALARLGVPEQRHGPGTRLRHRQFHEPGPRRACASSASNWTASPAASPRRSTPTRTSASRTSATRSLPEDRIDAVIGNVPFADLKLDYRGQKLSLHDFFFAKSIDALKPGGVLALVTTHFTLDKQNAAIREYLAVEGRFRRGDPPALRRLQARRHGRRHRHRVPAQACTRRTGPATPIPTGSASRRSPSTARRSRSIATS